MKLDRIKEMRRAFGDDTIFLIGGNLLEQGSDLEADAKKFAHVAGRDRPYCLPRELSRMMSSTIVEEKVTSSKYMKENSSYIGDVVERDTAVHSIADVDRVASNIRRRVLKYTLSNNGGYLSQACSSAETLATLYLRALRLGPSVALPVPGPFRGSPGPGLETITGEAYNGDPTDLTLDRLIFSPVHYAVVLYSLLVEVGRLDEKAFDSYNVDGSTVELIGAEHSPGHAVTAGSLAQALSQAAGIAYARKLKNATGRVAVFMSDGEFQEGQTWEAVQTMVNLKINVVIVVDVNGQQCDGEMKQVCNVGDLARKLRAFGAQVKQVDGHNVSEIEMAVRARSEVPSFVLCNTNPCQGIPLLNDRAPKLHYVRFRDTAEKMQFERVLVSMTDTVFFCRSDNKIGTTATQELSRVPFVNGKICPRAETPREEFSEVVRKVDVVNRPHREHLLQWMKLHPTSLVVTADLTSSCEADLIRDKLPQQYLSLGMAEQNMMSFCGGLSRENFTPWIHTFGVFCTRRPFDQLAMSIGVPNLNVKILGFLPGLTTPGGVTHQAIDDVALCRSIPNIRVLEVGDATEVLSVLDVAQGIDGPVYIRMLRGEVPRLFPSYSPMKFGTVRVLSEGNDVCLVTTGICTEEAIKAREMIKLSGIHVLHLHLSTIVPFPVNVVLNAASSCKYGIITMENHLISGGVGSATAEVLADYAVGKRLIRLGVPNCYAHGASRDYLVSEYGFDKYSLIKAIEKLCHRQLSIVEQEETRKQKQVSVKEPPTRVERPEDL
jgi:transketolase